jgi:Kef-type K+ transport system membrane component KefB
MFDDVVGLVMVKIISNLGGSADSFTVITVIRPVFVSIGFGIGLLLLCLLVLRPILRKALSMADKFPQFMGTLQFAFIVHTCILVGVVGGATYAGTSSLFAAYLSGVMISWFDSMAINSRESQTLSPAVEGSSESSTNNAERSASPTSTENGKSVYKIPTGERVYEKYYKAPVERILIPLFFASIGFAIPITEMFQGQVVWRGIVYAILMCFAKVITGLWLVRFSPPVFVDNAVSTITRPFSHMIFRRCYKRNESGRQETQQSADENSDHSNENKPKDNTNETAKDNESDEAGIKSSATKDTTNDDKSGEHIQPETASSKPSSSLSLPPKPKSLYPPAILGLAMVSRGEIGYLIASLAESQGMFSDGSSSGSSETYLVIIWAISLCTLFGPICVGTLVKRVKKLQQQRAGSGGPDPLGVWGI